jgi:hypothetical protein
MKINEFKKTERLDEGLGDALGGAARALVGDHAVSAIKGAFTGKGTKEQLTQDLFFKDFINDASSSLSNAVKSGIVNPNYHAQIGAQPVKPQGDGEGNPPQTAPTDEKPANFYGSATPSNVRKATPAPPQSNPLTAPTLKSNNVTTTVKPATAAPATGGITSGGLGYQAKPGATPSNVRKATPAPATGGITSGGLGYQAKPVEKSTTQPQPASAAAAPKQPTPSTPTSAQQTVAAAQQHRQGIANAQNVQAAGKAAAAKPGFQRTAADKLAMKAAGLSENEYRRLNAIFESIMEAEEENDEEIMSIGQYMLDWFEGYMQGTNWEKYKQRVIPLLQNVEYSWKRDKGKAAIKQLAKAAYAISGPANAKSSKQSGGSNQTSSGISDFGAGGYQSQPKATTSTDKETFAQLDAIKNTNPELFAKYMAQAQGKK